MNKVISIYEAKTQLSRLVKQAEGGATIFIGAYGHPQAMLSPAPTKKPIHIGVWEHKKKSEAYKDKDLIEPDQEISAAIEQNINRPLP